MLFRNPHKLIDSPDPKRRVKAVKAMTFKPGPEAAKLLEKALSDPDAEVRALAAIILSIQSKDWVKKDLVKDQVRGIWVVMEEASFIWRNFAIQVLGDIGTPEAGEALVSILASKGKTDDADMIMAIKTLGQLGLRRAVPSLIKSLETRFCRDAADALGKIGDPASADALLKALEEGNARAALALGTLGDNRAYEPLIKALNANKHRLQDVELITMKFIESGPPGDLEMRVNAALSLGYLGDRRAVEPLMITLLQSNKYVRKASAFALGKLKDPRAIDALISAMNDEDLAVAEIASVSLSRIGPAAMEPLIRRLDDPKTSHRVKCGSILALGLIGDPRTISVLEKSLAAVQDEIDKKLFNEKLIQIKELIIESLQYIRGEKSLPPLTESLEGQIFTEKAK